MGPLLEVLGVFNPQALRLKLTIVDKGLIRTCAWCSFTKCSPLRQRNI
jgi:hypothetical protein